MLQSAREDKDRGERVQVWIGLHVDATGGAQDGMGCHGRDSIPFLGPSPRGRGCKCRVQSAEATNADALKRSDPGCEQSGAGELLKQMET